MEARSSALATSHNLTVPLVSAEASVRPSGVKARQGTAPTCPERVARSLPAAGSHRMTLPGVLSSHTPTPAASVLPSGAKATDHGMPSLTGISLISFFVVAFQSLTVLLA